MTIKQADILETVILILFVSSLFIVGYTVTATIAQTSGVNLGNFIKIPLDSMIPLNKYTKWLVIPYLLDFVVVYLLAINIFVKHEFNPHYSRRLAWGFGFFVVAGYLFFIFFPISVMSLQLGELQDLSLNVKQSWIDKLIYFTYWFTPMWNSAPSYHTAMPWFVFRMQDDFSRFWKGVFFIWVILMATGAVVLRIHFWVDMVLGLLYAELMARLVRKIPAAIFNMGSEFREFYLVVVALSTILIFTCYFKTFHIFREYSDFGVNILKHANILPVS